MKTEHGISRSLKNNIEHVRDDDMDQLEAKDKIPFMNDGMNHPLRTDIVQFADDPKRGTRRPDEDWLYSNSNGPVEYQIIRELHEEEDTKKVTIDEMYIDDELHNSEVISNAPDDFHVKMSYQIPSFGFIDTEKILTESEYNAEKLEEDKGTSAFEIDMPSDEEEF